MGGFCSTQPQVTLSVFSMKGGGGYNDDDADMTSLVHFQPRQKNVTVSALLHTMKMCEIFLVSGENGKKQDSLAHNLTIERYLVCK